MTGREATAISASRGAITRGQSGGTGQSHRHQTRMAQNPRRCPLEACLWRPPSASGRLLWRSRRARGGTPPGCDEMLERHRPGGDDVEEIVEQPEGYDEKANRGPRSRANQRSSGRLPRITDDRQSPDGDQPRTAVAREAHDERHCPRAPVSRVKSFSAGRRLRVPGRPVRPCARCSRIQVTPRPKRSVDHHAPKRPTLEVGALDLGAQQDPVAECAHPIAEVDVLELTHRLVEFPRGYERPRLMAPSPAQKVSASPAPWRGIRWWSRFRYCDTRPRARECECRRPRRPRRSRRRRGKHRR